MLETAEKLMYTNKINVSSIEIALKILCRQCSDKATKMLQSKRKHLELQIFLEGTQVQQTKQGKFSK